jgi:hypothetical protein
LKPFETDINFTPKKLNQIKEKNMITNRKALAVLAFCSIGITNSLYAETTADNLPIKIEDCYSNPNISTQKSPMEMELCRSRVRINQQIVETFKGFDIDYQGNKEPQLVILPEKPPAVPPKNDAKTASRKLAKTGKIKDTKLPKPAKPTKGKSAGKKKENPLNRPSLSLRPGVYVSPKLAIKLSQVGDKYYVLVKKKKPLDVTSATRDSRAQARAMKGLIDRHGEKHVRKLYKNKSATKEILAANRQHPKNRKAGVEAMTRVIDRQIARGVYISNHLKSQNFDVGRNTNEKALNSAIRTVNGSCFYEKDHYHCSAGG